MTDTRNLIERLRAMAPRDCEPCALRFIAETGEDAAKMANADINEAADALSRLTDERDRLWEALRHWRFFVYWRVDGMNIEQARIHADAWITEMKAQEARAAISAVGTTGAMSDIQDREGGG